MGKSILFMLFFSVTATLSHAQYWPAPPPSEGRWIRFQDLPSNGRDTYSWEIAGGVPMVELQERGLTSMAAGRPDYNYFKFIGDVEEDIMGIPVYVLAWPPSSVKAEQLYELPNRYHFINTLHSGFCNCDCLAPTPDTLYFCDAFGFWWNDPNYPGNIWGINRGYTILIDHIYPWVKQPCPPASPWYGKDPLYFTDSTYQALPPDAILSAQSPLYLKATTTVPPPTLSVSIQLKYAPETTLAVDMTYYPALREWHGKLDSTKYLGVKSFNTAVARSYYPGRPDSVWDRVEVDLALPRILTQVDNAYTDTVFIRSDSMKVARDLTVSLRFYQDSTNNEAGYAGLVDSAGYNYKSRWIANANRPPTSRKTYYRQFPADNSYRWWNDSTQNYAYTFRRDSLYAVGGKLTIECKGALDTVININNSFIVRTDTMATNNRDTLQTKLILIDKDPDNTRFLDSLQYDIVKAIAYQEYAGSNDPAHCHNGAKYNPQWNHYWDNRIEGADTCRDSKTPCENRWGVDTGIMQIYRVFDTTGTSGWENWFATAGHSPPGYTVIQWDNMTWDWKIHISNGKYIHDTYMPAKFTAIQQAFPESCSFADCDTFPSRKNKEDLKSYGYHRGENYMKQINNDEAWNTYIADTLHNQEYSVYVQNARIFCICAKCKKIYL